MWRVDLEDLHSTTTEKVVQSGMFRRKLELKDCTKFNVNILV